MFFVLLYEELCLLIFSYLSKSIYSSFVQTDFAIRGDHIEHATHDNYNQLTVLD